MGEWEITVRPWKASGGSTVHDETLLVEADSSRQALLKFYQAEDYDFTIWRVIDIVRRGPEVR
jgi:hypothetical protein